MSRLCHHYLIASLTLWAFAAPPPAHAEDEQLASFRLRGGYDSNPTMLLEARGATFAGVDAVAAVARSVGDVAAGLTAEASHTRYEDPGIDPLERYQLRGSVELSDFGGFTIRSSGLVSYFANYETRAFDAEQSVRVQYMDGPVRPFVSASLRYSSLNETNAILGEFLPDPQSFLRGSLIPGIAVRNGPFEVGASLNLSATRYTQRFDLFGFRRDNERIQPFVFASYEGERFSLFGSLSQLYGDWHEVDFSDVRRTMFELTASYRGDDFDAEFSAIRFATDTTFPISPISVDTELSARLTRRIDDVSRVSLFGRRLDREFLDSPFRSRQYVFGIEASRDFAEDYTLSAELSRVRMEPMVGEPIHALIASVSLARRFGAGADAKLPETGASRTGRRTR